MTRKKLSFNLVDVLILLVIAAAQLDFENRPEDFALITDKIDAELFGLFK